MGWLIDTNCWISYLKGRNPGFAKRLASTCASDVFTCSVVLAELLHGARKYDAPRDRELRVRKALSPFTCLPFDESAASTYAMIRDELERRTAVIGPYDLQIAAIALANDLTLVTGNTREFNRVSGLRVEDWS
jgi:tRNA(fMet)-specific endonuclease VapC